VDDGANELPLTVRVNAVPPARALLGDNDVATGAGVNDVSTVTGGLVAARVKPLFKNSRNS
jgi:hypothetical protein